MENADILIDTSIVHDIPVMTLNQEHFQRIETLRLITPPEIRG